MLKGRERDGSGGERDGRGMLYGFQSMVMESLL